MAPVLRVFATCSEKVFVEEQAPHSWPALHEKQGFQCGFVWFQNKARNQMRPQDLALVYSMWM